MQLQSSAEIRSDKGPLPPQLQPGNTVGHKIPYDFELFPTQIPKQPAAVPAAQEGTPLSRVEAMLSSVAVKHSIAHMDTVLAGFVNRTDLPDLLYLPAFSQGSGTTETDPATEPAAVPAKPPKRAKRAAAAAAAAPVSVDPPDSPSHLVEGAAGSGGTQAAADKTSSTTESVELRATQLRQVGAVHLRTPGMTVSDFTSRLPSISVAGIALPSADQFIQPEYAIVYKQLATDISVLSTGLGGRNAVAYDSVSPQQQLQLLHYSQVVFGRLDLAAAQLGM